MVARGIAQRNPWHQFISSKPQASLVKHGLWLDVSARCLLMVFRPVAFSWFLADSIAQWLSYTGKSSMNMPFRTILKARMH